MKRYFAVVSMMCLFTLVGIAGTTAQEAQKASPPTDFKYDLNEAGDGVVIQKYKGTATEVVIPAVIEDFPVVAVGYRAFSETNIVSIVFPDSIERMDSECFYFCKSLQKVVLPKNLKTIPYKMCDSCKALKQITLPDGIRIIEGAAFSSSGLESVTIPDSVMVIAYTSFSLGAFEGCQNLKTVHIGNGMKCIERNSFRYCTNLTTVNIGVEKLEKGSYVESYETGYGEDVFLGCSALTLKERKKIRDTGYTDGF